MLTMEESAVCLAVLRFVMAIKFLSKCLDFLAVIFFRLLFNNEDIYIISTLLASFTSHCTQVSLRTMVDREVTVT